MTSDIQAMSSHRTVNNGNRSQSKQQTDLMNTTMTLQMRRFVSICIQPLYDKSDSLLPCLLIFNTQINMFVGYKEYSW